MTGIGKVRQDLMGVFHETLPVAKQLTNDNLVADVALAWSLPHHQQFLTENYSDWKSLSAIWWELDSPKELDKWWSVLRALVKANLSFDIVDISAYPPDATKTLIYAGPDYADVVTINHLQEFISQGGRLITIGDLPQGDLAGKISEEAKELNYMAARSTKMMHVAVEKVVSTLQQLGISPGIDVSEQEVFTSLYEAEIGAGWWGFIWNLTEDAMDVDLRLKSGILSQDSEYELRWFTNAMTTVKGSGSQIATWSMNIEPSGVEVFRIVASPAL
jgi:hypothetical protein